MPPVAEPQRIVHVISTADTGGAEIMLAGLVEAHRALGVESHIVVLGAQGSLSERFSAAAASVIYLGIGRGKVPSVAQCAQLWGASRRIRPQAVHGWMPHGMLAAWLARLAAPGDCAMVWGVHQTLYTLDDERPLTSRLIRILARLSSRADAIAYVSHVSRTQHEALGFDRRRGVLVDNSVDTVRFSPDSEARREQRRVLGIPDQAAVIGYVGRKHPQKDIDTLLAALGRVLSSMPDAHAVVVGSGLDVATIGSMLEPDLSGRTHCLGRRGDVDRIIHAFDVLLLTSAYGEAAPTVVLEAMACGVPSVVTDVGDSARLAGDLGAVAQPRDALGLAEAACRLLGRSEAQRSGDSVKLRAEAERRFSIERMAREYLRLYAGA